MENSNTQPIVNKTKRSYAPRAPKVPTSAQEEEKVA